MTRYEADNIKRWFEVGLKEQLKEGKINETEAQRLREELANDVEQLLK